MDRINQLKPESLQHVANEALVLLHKNARDGLTISELSRAAGIDLNKATRVLVMLEKAKTARCRKVGIAKLYFPVENKK